MEDQRVPSKPVESIMLPAIEGRLKPMFHAVNLIAQPKNVVQLLRRADKNKVKVIHRTFKRGDKSIESHEAPQAK